jgi:predicted urease superfamily metal-dependent hydrolase
MAWRLRILKRSRSEQEVDDVAFVGLHPVELDRLHLADCDQVLHPIAWYSLLKTISPNYRDC